MINYVFDIYAFGENEDIDRITKKVFKVKASSRSVAYDKANKKYPNHFIELKNYYADEKMSDGGNINMDETEIDIDKEGDVIKVYYVKGDIGFDGRLRKYNSGRAIEYEFEPSYFDDEESESYYDENSDSIEKEILNKFYSNK